MQVEWFEIEWNEGFTATAGGVEAHVFLEDEGVWGWFVRATSMVSEWPEPWATGGRHRTASAAKAKAASSLKRAVKHYAGSIGPGHPSYT